MSKQVDYYKILQVHHDAGQDIIDAAYRCLSKIYHPDVNKSPMAVERMKEINVAYGVLGDGKKRKLYHIEWLKAHPVTLLSTAAPVRDRRSPEPDPSSEAKKELEAATCALDDFFSETVRERWEKAYQKLTQVDRDNISLEDFLEWKKAVSQVYKLGTIRSHTSENMQTAIMPE